jgi:hypothetical protein
VYQTLDAIDGKQARRTGTSSPMGELFDHGCDSVSNGKGNNGFNCVHLIGPYGTGAVDIFMKIRIVCVNLLKLKVLSHTWKLDP